MTDLLALLAAYGSASCTPSAGGRAGTDPNECTADAREQCKAFPCIDLREADNHHHPMWLNSPGNAGVMYYREDGSGAAGRGAASSTAGSLSLPPAPSPPATAAPWRQRRRGSVPMSPGRR